MKYTDREVALLMRTHGGPFVKSLGSCFLVADERNKEKIKDCFRLYWQHYKNIGKKQTKNDEQQEIIN